MKMKPLLLLVAGMLLGVQGVWADDLTPEAAKQKAAAFLQQKASSVSGVRRAQAAPTAAQLQSVAVDAENRQWLYRSKQYA